LASDNIVVHRKIAFYSSAQEQRIGGKLMKDAEMIAPMKSL